MGDRAQIVIKNGDDQVCLYTHWNAAELPDQLARALQRGKGRWNDAPYLARIIFCEMIRDDKSPLDGETGFGISSYIQDETAPRLIVNMKNQNVRGIHGGTETSVLSFADFIDMRLGGE